MTAANTDYFTKVGEPGQATTMSAPGHAIGGVSINVDSTSLWPTDTGVIFAIDTTTLVSGVETRVAGTYTVWEGVVSSGTSIGSMVLKTGTDQNYSAGATTRVYILPTSARENRMVDGLLVQHKQTGAHAAITADSIVIADGGTLDVDTINEATAAAGVTIDGMPVKDKLVVGGAAQGVANSSLSTTAGGIGGAMKAWTPTITATSGTFTTLTTTAEYSLIGTLCFYHIKVIETNIGTASGNFIFTLPLTAATTASLGLVGVGREDALTGNTLLIRYQDTTHFFTSSAILNNYQLVISGWYPVA